MAEAVAPDDARYVSLTNGAIGHVDRHKTAVNLWHLDGVEDFHLGLSEWECMLEVDSWVQRQHRPGD